MDILIKSKYRIGDIVYLVTDEDQKLYLITALIIEPKTVKYRIANGANREIECCDFEITETKKIF